MNLELWKNVAIILLAFFALIQTILVIVLAVVLLRLALSLQQRLGPILDSAKDTMGTVESTTKLASGLMVKPMIRVVSFAVGVRQAVAFLIKLAGQKGGKAS